jgi:hypothetical protein
MSWAYCDPKSSTSTRSDCCEVRSAGVDVMAAAAGGAEKPESIETFGGKVL